MWWIKSVHANDFCVEVEALAHVAHHDCHIVHLKDTKMLFNIFSEVRRLSSYPFPKLANATDIFFLFFIDNIDAWCLLCKVQGIHGILHLVAGAEPDVVTIWITQVDLKEGE